MPKCECGQQNSALVLVLVSLGEENTDTDNASEICDEFPGLREVIVLYYKDFFKRLCRCRYQTLLVADAQEPDEAVIGD